MNIGICKGQVPLRQLCPRKPSSIPNADTNSNPYSDHIQTKHSDKKCRPIIDQSYQSLKLGKDRYRERVRLNSDQTFRPNDPTKIQTKCRPKFRELRPTSNHKSDHKIQSQIETKVCPSKLLRSPKINVK